MRFVPPSLALGVVLALGGWTVAQEPQPGVEVLQRGPVHEAYAEAVDGQAQPSPLVPKAPPELLQEVPPDQKPAGNNVVWIPGYWDWDADRNDYVWVSGFWRVPPPGRTWVPGSWRQVNGGWQWTHGLWAQPEQPELQYVPQPPPTVEAGPSVPAPESESVYVSGSWMYRDAWLWRPGYWLAPRPGYVWVPARYRWTPAGFIYLNGYWDYALADRGLLFAPVYVSPVVYARPFVWTPTIAISYQCLFGSLFVYRPSCHYYYGDYFANRYVRGGFIPWIDYRIGRGRFGGFDPLYGYYRSYYARRDALWARDLRELYVGRARGLAVRNIAVTNAAVRHAATAPLLTPLARIGPQVGGLQRLTAEQRARQQHLARQFQNVATQRRRQETRLSTRPLVAGPGAPRSVRLDLPKSPIVAVPPTLRTPTLPVSPAVRTPSHLRDFRPPTPTIPTPPARTPPQPREFRPQAPTFPTPPANVGKPPMTRPTPLPVGRPLVQPPPTPRPPAPQPRVFRPAPPSFPAPPTSVGKPHFERPLVQTPPVQPRGRISPPTRPTSPPPPLRSFGSTFHPPAPARPAAVPPAGNRMPLTSRFESPSSHSRPMSVPSGNGKPTIRSFQSPSSHSRPTSSPSGHGKPPSHLSGKRH